MASKITDMHLGDSVEISKLITKKEIADAKENQTNPALNNTKNQT